MIRKIAFAVFFVSVLAAVGTAADSDNAAVPPSYFEGVWVGSWESFLHPSVRQDVTLTIEKGAKEGVFNVEYSWGGVELMNRRVTPGSLKSRGRQEGDQFFFQWKNKQGNENKITLQKVSENKVKARLDQGGPLTSVERPSTETYLNRR